MSEPILPALAEAAGATEESPAFRDRSMRVGAVYTLSYTQAIVAVYDFDRERAGGLAKGMFLLAAKQTGDESFLLLRIQREARLPNATSNDETRQRAIESSGNEEAWDGKLDEWMRDQLSLHAVECSVLGTFIQQHDGYRYAEDIENYYAVHELMVWKPDSHTLSLIVNHRHRSNDVPIDQPLTKIGTTRFAAAERESATKADFSLDPTDVLKRRTVYLGMSRSGKSNGMKIVAEAIYRLRTQDLSKCRVGQLIFDLSGEYAQDNPQDGKALHCIHEVIGVARDGEVETYGLLPVPWDPDRKIMKINFFGEPFPPTWRTVDVEQAMDQLLAGREIVKGIMAHLTTIYTTSFRDADLAVPLDAEGSRGIQTRYRRAILAYQTALAAAGLTLPSWQPSVQGLFGKDIIDAMSPAQNAGSDNQTDYNEAATILTHAKQDQGRIEWTRLEIVFRALSKFVEDKKSGFGAFENAYITKSSSGEGWADPRLRSVIRIFASQNGPRMFQTAQQQHSPDVEVDFAERVVADLRKGKLVIIDQSAGDPEQNRTAAERVMWRIFLAQQDLFRRQLAQTTERDPTEGHIVVYLEEAHNLLPRANAANNLQTVWARSAKEGSKLNIGMVLATQAPSSVMPEILSETDNWILSYLNSESERRVIAGYMDFADFLEQIGKVSEQGFVRIRTLSQAYTVPVQLDKFRIDETSTERVAEDAP